MSNTCEIKNGYKVLIRRSENKKPFEVQVQISIVAKYCNKPSGSKKGEYRVNQLGYCQLFKK